MALDRHVGWLADAPLRKGVSLATDRNQPLGKEVEMSFPGAVMLTPFRNSAALCVKYGPAQICRQERDGANTATWMPGSLRKNLMLCW